MNDDGVYHFWIEGSGPVYGGTVSKEQLVNLVRSTSDAVQDQLWACASSDYGKCSASDDGYVVKTARGIACWHYDEVMNSCNAAADMAVFRDLLDDVAMIHGGS